MSAVASTPHRHGIGTEPQASEVGPLNPILQSNLQVWHSPPPRAVEPPVPPKVLSDLSPAKLDERTASVGLQDATDDVGGPQWWKQDISTTGFAV